MKTLETLDLQMLATVHGGVEPPQWMKDAAGKVKDFFSPQVNTNVNTGNGHINQNSGNGTQNIYYGCGEQPKK